MKYALKKHSALALLLGTAAFGCGKISQEEHQTSYRGKANESLRAASSNLQVAPELKLKGSLEAGAATGQRLHEMTSHLRLEFEHLAVLGLSGSEKLLFKMQVRDASQRIVWENEQETEVGGEDLIWKPKLSGDEGSYQLELKVWVRTEEGKKEIASQSSSFVLDTSLPVMTIEALLSAVTDGGRRDLSISARVLNEQNVECSDAQLLHPSLPEPLALKLNPMQRDGQILLEGKVQDLSSALANGNVLIKLKCRDAAGNVTDLAQAPILAGERAINLGIGLGAKRGLELEAGTNAPLRAFLSRPELELKLNLFDPETSLPHTEAFIAAEKATLRVYVTETPVEQLDELLKNKTVLWNQLYAPAMKLALPASYQGAHTLYLSLVRHEISQNKSTLLASTPIPVYVDGTGAELKWLSGPALAAPLKDKIVTLKLENRLQGAPLGAPLMAEYTLDGSSWQPLPLTVKATSELLSELEFAYPLSTEAPFRVRIKAVDLAGNMSYSALSPQIVAPSGLPSLVVPAAERGGCVSGTNPGAQLKVHLASSFACKKADALGLPVGQAHASLLIQNRGQVAPEFYSTSQISAAMGYRIVGDGQVLAQGRISPPELFRMDPGQLRLLHFALNPSWLSAKKLELLFDAEESDAYSSTNSCYPDATFPSVVIQNSDQGQSLKMSPFACDAEELFPETHSLLRNP